MEKFTLKPKKADAPEKKEVKRELPSNVARKYEAVVTPKTLLFQNPDVRIDMRTMTMEQADALYEYSPGTYLKLTKDAAAEAKKN